MNADFWSSVESGDYLDEMRSELATRGVELVPRFQVSRSDYRAVASPWGRAWLRWQGYVAYPIVLAADFIRRRHPEVSIVTTNPFSSPWLATRLASRSRPVVNLVYDLYPEALVVSGAIPAGGLRERMIACVTKDTLHRCAANVFLGKRLLDHATARHGAIPHATVIPVGAAARFFARFPPRPRPPREPVRVLYCGHLGWMHDVQTFTAACRQSIAATAGRSIEARFHATGPRVDELTRALGTTLGVTRTFPGGLTVTVASPAADQDWHDLMLSADVGLVTLRPGAETVAMPSKTYSAMVAGQAILAVCSLDSDLADLVLEHDCGWVVVPEGAASPAPAESLSGRVLSGPAGLREALRLIATDREQLQRKRANAYDAGQRLFSAAAVANQWSDLLGHVAGGTPRFSDSP